MKNLYSFKKNSTHARFFKWIYGIDPTIRFKSMCPYFWSYIFTILFLPLILIIKLFGKSGTKFLDYLHDYKRNRNIKTEKAFVEKYKDPSKFTDQECFNIYNSKCYNKYCYELGWDERDEYSERSNRYGRELKKKFLENKLRKEETIKAVKENKFTQAVGIVLALIMIVFISYIIFQLGKYTYHEVDWMAVGSAILIIIAIIGTCFLCLLFVFYVLRPFFNWLKCLPLPKCRLCKLNLWKYIKYPFVALFMGVCILCDMVHNIYKKNCPLITWEKE